MATKAKNDSIIRNQDAINGLQQNYEVTEKIRLRGKVYTVAQLIALYTDNTAKIRAANKAEKAWHGNVAAQNESEGTLAPIHALLAKRLLTEYDPTSETIGEFGIEPPKQGKKSAQTKATAVERALATREARGTVGPKKKQKIKGQLASDTSPANPPEQTTTPAPTPTSNEPASNGPASNGPASNGKGATQPSN